MTCNCCPNNTNKHLQAGECASETDVMTGVCNIHENRMHIHGKHKQASLTSCAERPLGGRVIEFF